MADLDAWIASAKARCALVERQQAALRDRRRRNTVQLGVQQRQTTRSNPAALGSIAPHLPPL